MSKSIETESTTVDYNFSIFVQYECLRSHCTLVLDEDQYKEFLEYLNSDIEHQIELYPNDMNQTINLVKNYVHITETHPYITTNNGYTCPSTNLILEKDLFKEAINYARGKELKNSLRY